MEWSAAIREHFARVADERGVAGPAGELIALLATGWTEPGAYLEVVDRRGVRREVWFHKDRLDLVLGFVAFALEIGRLDADHLRDVTQLKEWLEVADGEFAAFRPAEVATLLQAQLEDILEDFEIDSPEDLYQFELQRAFDLGYDQYLTFTRPVVERVWAELAGTVAIASAASNASTMQLRRQAAALEPLYRLATSHAPRIGARP
ncbi:MAG: hypothetical protein ABJD07_01435 [Gemmatimonadaceae bacterium]